MAGDKALFNAVDGLVREHLGSSFPAAAAAVFHEGQLVLNAGWGVLNPDSSGRARPATPETRFDLASVTKLFTTTAFLSLVSEGKTGLDAPLADVLPEFATSGPRPVDGGQDPHSKRKLDTPPDKLGLRVDPARITFRRLLTHTSGLAPWRDVYNAAGGPPTPPDTPDPTPRPVRWARALEALCQYPFVSAPDGIVRYSDLGLMLLGEATARLHGAPLDETITARVLRPLAVDAACFNPVREGRVPREQCAPTEDDPAWRKRRIWGEVHDENACGVGGVAGHAGLFADALSVARLGQAWLDSAGVFGIDPALAQEAASEQAATAGERRGLGWMLKSVENSSAGERFSADSFGHTGFTGTSLWIDPAAQLVVAALTNAVYGGRERLALLGFRRALHERIWDVVCR
ncbi:MAG: beta-lactamase family protein [Anaerolineae bacterium]|nr:beta-lactamase family protein [Anaerolineae bacterium]